MKTEVKGHVFEDTPHAIEATVSVLHIGYGARGGGVGQVMTDVAFEMRRSGFHCSVAFFGVISAFSDHIARLKGAGIPCYDIVRTPGLDLRGLRALAGFVRREQ